VYDRSNGEAFLGHVRLTPELRDGEYVVDGWYKLQPRSHGEEGTVSGEIKLQMKYNKVQKKHYGPLDFEILKLIGKGKCGSRRRR
jgi:serine/threonine protein kinase SCH9